MKLTIVLLAVVVICVVTAVPTKKDDNTKKAIRPEKKPCLKNCELDYKPICAGNGDEKAKKLSFGSICVMENYNCERGETLKKVSDGECPGGGGVRLS